MAEGLPRRVTHEGPAYLEAVTRLCRRARSEHPTRGVWEAADFHWWWRRPRPTDDLPQSFWLDGNGRPIAASILTDWGERIAVDVVTTIEAADLVGVAWADGLERAQALGKPVETMVNVDDAAMAQLVREAGLVDAGGRGGSAWIDAHDLPPVVAVPAGYRSTTRAADASRPHHFSDRNGPDVEARLARSSMYRADLDVVVVTSGGDVASYGLFWFDEVTRTGFVEPMGTATEHRRRGLARHVLTAGLAALRVAGADRVRINYDDGHEPSRKLYLDLGFEPVMSTVLYVGD